MSSTKSPYEGEPYSEWAPKMWQQFEALGNNFKDSQSFAQGVRHLGSQIPCPECHNDFNTYVQSNPPENVKSKQQATQWVSAYHQHVNQVAGTQQGQGWYGFGEVPLSNNNNNGWDESDETWNTEMWSALHEAAEQFDPEDFAPFVYECIFNVPCEGCEDHSLQFAQEYPPEEVTSQEEALYWMCQFHNWASIDAGNGLVDCDSDPQGNGYISGHSGNQGFYYGGGGGSSGGGRGGGHGGSHGGRHGGGHGGGIMGGGHGGRGGRRGRHGHGGMQQQQQGMNGGGYDYE